MDEMNLSNINTIRDVLTRHGFTFSKSLGQNFLINPGICPKIAEMGGAQKGCGVIEIGTGIGVLTAELLKRANKVVAVEIDSRLIPVIQETLSGYDNLKIINDDILKVDIRKLIAEEFSGMPVYICANLPYYITSPIIMSVLEARLPVKALTVMVQKEAAKRICALPATRDVGAVSIAVRYFSDPRVLFSVSRGSFMPSPNVDSAVIRLDIKQDTPKGVSDEKFFFKFVRAAFSMRRKTLVNAVSNGLKIDKKIVLEALSAENINLAARAEQLTMEQFIALSGRIFKIIY